MELEWEQSGAPAAPSRRRALHTLMPTVPAARKWSRSSAQAAAAATTARRSGLEGGWQCRAEARRQAASQLTPATAPCVRLSTAAYKTRLGMVGG